MKIPSAKTPAIVKDRPWIGWTCTALLILYALAVIVKMALEPELFQVNFRIYYYAAQAFSRGLDPYDSEVLHKLAGGKMVLPCGYPPLVLHVFKPLAWFDYVTSYRIFLLLKSVALIFLLWLWQNCFLQRGLDNVFLLVCLFGFNYALYYDFQAGNINLFEQLILWLGLYCYIRGRLGVFVILIVAAASFKLTPICFLGLLVMAKDKRKWMWLAGGSVFFAIVLAGSFLLYNDLSHAFLESIREMQGIVSADGEGTVSIVTQAPATWPLINLVFARGGEKIGIDIPKILPIMCFAAFLMMILCVTYFAFRVADEKDQRKRDILLVVLACFVYLMAMPRLLVYSYVIGLFPAYYVIRNLKRGGGVLLLITMMVVSTIPCRPPGFKFLVETLANYHPLLIVYFLWALCLYNIWASGTERSCDRSRDTVMET